MTPLDTLASRPWRAGFMQLARALDQAFRHVPRIGDGRHPREEAVRFGSESHLGFRASDVAEIVPPSARSPGEPFDRASAGRVIVNFAGLVGPNGPLPLHLVTRLQRNAVTGERPELAEFLDVFHHRHLAMAYRAWRKARPAVEADRPESDGYAAKVAAFCGMQPDATSVRDTGRPGAAEVAGVADVLVVARRSPETLRSVMRRCAGIDVTVHPFRASWQKLRGDQRWGLGRGSRQALGCGAVLGAAVLDRQHALTLRSEPLDLEAYRQCLPGTGRHRDIGRWTVALQGREVETVLELRVRGETVAGWMLGRPHAARLGWDAWLGRCAPVARGFTARLSLPATTSNPS